MMAARMCALTDFNRKVLGPPTNTVWLYLFIHQLLYEKVAIMYPADCGFESTKGAQAVETAVNIDLKDLLIARGDFVGLLPKKQSQHLKGYKVLLSLQVSHVLTFFSSAELKCSCRCSSPLLKLSGSQTLPLKNDIFLR